MKFLYWLAWITFGAAFRSFLGLRIDGREHLVTEGPVLVAANHQSFLDPPLIGCLYDMPLFYLARKTLFSGFTNWLYRQWNALPVDQDKPDMASLKSIIRLLKAGHGVVIFPEGARTLDGSLGEAAPGIGLVAAKSGAVIQPVRIRGAFEALPRGASWLRLARVSVCIGPAIRLTPDDLTHASGREGYALLAKRIMSAIAAL
ncbi:MAG: lysophospholipid acyltransferase family protein [Verrucomicrobia bacterium]|nr:lysophospholipid acyltransferase family protein [Verrucomicrobiota bacterium]